MGRFSAYRHFSLRQRSSYRWLSSLEYPKIFLMIKPYIIPFKQIPNLCKSTNAHLSEARRHKKTKQIDK
jgi:hypothetical protein